MQVGFQKDSKWLYTGSEDGTIKIFDIRAPNAQQEYESRGAVNTVLLHPNQGELITGALASPHEILPSLVAMQATAAISWLSGANHIVYQIAWASFHALRSGQILQVYTPSRRPPAED